MPPSPRALIVDPRPARAGTLERAARRAGFTTQRLQSSAEALAGPICEEHALLVCAMDLPGHDGVDLWTASRTEDRLGILVAEPHTPAKTIVRAFHAGIFDALVWPAEDSMLNTAFERAAALVRHREHVSRRRTAGRGYTAPIAASTAMQRTLGLLDRVAPTPLPVLLTGETGTGKGVLARYVHAHSPRADGPFLSINCGALPETLLESELFGHEKGAFTGADRRRTGLLEAADGGTLFLDEINSAPLAFQVRLLHFVQEQRFTRVGGTASVDVDVRLVIAGNRPLEPLVRAGDFRQDLYYRLNVFPIDVPPLRERREDISPLAATLVVRHAERLDRPAVACAPGVLEALKDHDWPGNVRELDNVIQRALVLARGDRVELSDLPRDLLNRDRPAARCDRLPWQEDATLAEVEWYWIRHVLDRCDGNRSQAARLLDINPTTLWRRLRARNATT